MKIFYVGYHNPHFIGITEYIEKAILEMGHRIDIFDFRSWLIPGRIRAAVPVLDSLDRKRMNADLFGKVKKFRPDVLLVNGGWTIFPETITAIKKATGAITVNWIADFPLMFNEYAASGPYYDHFFTSGTDALERYRKAGRRNGHWLPFACDPNVQRPLDVSEEDRAKYGCDICFVGSKYTERVEILEKLTDLDLGIWGIGWDRLPESSPLGRFVRGNVVTPAEWVKIFSASKIALNIIGHRCDVMEPYVEEKDFRMTNTKVFEILGCGAFQLVDARADAVTLFKDKEHLAFYKGPGDVAGLARYYLEHPEERARVAAAGREEALAKHTYRHRIAEMLSVIGAAGDAK